MGTLAIGVGGLEIAAALAGRPYSLTMPRIIGVRLDGELSPWVSAKDVILHLLNLIGVKGGVGAVLEYCGPGVGTLDVPERATIANMGAETGATTSIFPADEMTRDFLRRQEREEVYSPLRADTDAGYSREITIDLSALVPLAACPHSPDNIRPVAELGEIRVDQVCIGSCTNSSYRDLMTAAAVLKGKKIDPGVSLVISPGSRQVLKMISDNGALSDLIEAGARVLENTCGPCIGMGQAPPSGSVSLRTYNRNFKGRSGTADSGTYLVSPATGAAAALTGRVTDPRSLGSPHRIELPDRFWIDDSGIIPPAPDSEGGKVRKGPNIRSLPPAEPLPSDLRASVWLVAGDNITTDDIMPAGAKVLPYRSNIEKISKFVFSGLAPGFVDTARAETGAGRCGVIVAGQNYGQGSSREHAALAPRYLGLRAVIAGSFARIHRSNLINFGVLPLLLLDENLPAGLGEGARLVFPALKDEVVSGKPVSVRIESTGNVLSLDAALSGRERDLILAGGLLNYLKSRAT